jgi:hypothetical protein
MYRRPPTSARGLRPIAGGRKAPLAPHLCYRYNDSSSTRRVTSNRERGWEKERWAER